MNVIIFSDVNGVIGYGRYGGAYRVATELRMAGYSAQVIEFFADLTLKDLEDIAERYIDKDTLFVGFATTLMIRKTKLVSVSRLDRSEENKYSGHLPHHDEFVQEMFAIFKRKNPRVKIVVGGGRSATTSLPGVDYWVWGAADKSIIALADHLKSNTPLTLQPGRTGQVISSNTSYPFHEFTHSKIIWEDQDHIFHGEHLPIETARGCIFRCTFCANTLWKKKGESIKVSDVLKEELLRNYDLYGTTGYMFCDDTYNDTLEKTVEFNKVFSQLPYQMEWTGYGRVDVISKNPEQREILLESGIRAILFGIETFHPVAGKGVGKGLHPEKIKETLYHLKETWKGKVVITGSFVVGLPGEPEESIWETVEWLKQDDCPIDDAVFSPLNIRATTDDPNAPASKISADPEKYGYKITGPILGTGVSTHGPQWSNEFMDKARAEKVAKEIQEIFMKRQTIANWAVYSRLRSLNYTHDEIIGKNFRDENFVEDANARKDRMRQEYMRKILA